MARSVGVTGAGRVRLVGVAGRLTQSLAVKAALAAAAGVGLTLGGGSAAWAGLQRQAKLASERIGMVEVPPPVRDGVYFPDGRHQQVPARGSRPLRVAMLGDSTSAGFGAADADTLPGVMLVRALASGLRRPVQLFTHAVVGTGAADLARQRDDALLDGPIWWSSSSGRTTSGTGCPPPIRSGS